MDPRPAVFIDRDGTMIKQVEELTLPSQIELLPKTAVSLASLNRAGFLVIGITNQPIIEKGKLTLDGLDTIHARLAELLAEGDAHFDAFFTCPHRYNPKNQCDCRKPGPGLIAQAKSVFAIDMKKSWFVGDRLRDVETGRRVGIRTILVGERGSDEDDMFFPDTKPDFLAESLFAATSVILNGHSA